MQAMKQLDQELIPGDRARDFTLKDRSGKEHHLSDYRGRWLVLYFYTKDDTPGCTKEACRFRDNITTLDALDAQIVGISVDNADSHARFAEKYGLPFPLLVDKDGNVARTYGSLRSLGPIKYARRHTFIIDPRGKVALIYRRIRPSRHSREVINDLRMLQRGYPH